VPVIEQLSGVSNVNVAGTTQPTLRHRRSNLLAANNLTLTDVVSAIAPNNVRAPGGYVYARTRNGTRRARRPRNAAASRGSADHVTYSGTTAAAATGAAGSFTSGLGGPVGAATSDHCDRCVAEAAPSAPSSRVRCVPTSRMELRAETRPVIRRVRP